jgi:hypothetical protein
MAINYKSTFSNQGPSKIYPNRDFWIEKKPSGNPAQASLLWKQTEIAPPPFFTSPKLTFKHPLNRCRLDTATVDRLIKSEHYREWVMSLPLTSMYPANRVASYFLSFIFFFLEFYFWVRSLTASGVYLGSQKKYWKVQSRDFNLNTIDSIRLVLSSYINLHTEVGR